MSHVTTISISSHTTSWPLQLCVLYGVSDQGDLLLNSSNHHTAITDHSPTDSKENHDMPPEMASDDTLSPPFSSNPDHDLDPCMDFSVSYLLLEMQSIADASKTESRSY
jgi:hypothetical protein